MNQQFYQEYQKLVRRVDELEARIARVERFDVGEFDSEVKRKRGRPRKDETREVLG